MARDTFEQDGHPGEVARPARRHRRLLSAMRIAPLVLAMGVGATVASCGGGGAGEGDVPPGLREGREIYRSRCASCHGSGGGGGVGPALGDGRVVERYPDIADEIAIVRDGRGVMPAYEGVLTAEQLEAVVGYTREGL